MQENLVRVVMGGMDILRRGDNKNELAVKKLKEKAVDLSLLLQKLFLILSNMSYIDNQRITFKNCVRKLQFSAV